MWVRKMESKTTLTRENLKNNNFQGDYLRQISNKISGLRVDETGEGLDPFEKLQIRKIQNTKFPYTIVKSNKLLCKNYYGYNFVFSTDCISVFVSFR